MCLVLLIQGGIFLLLSTDKVINLTFLISVPSHCHNTKRRSISLLYVRNKKNATVNIFPKLGLCKISGSPHSARLFPCFDFILMMWVCVCDLWETERRMGSPSMSQPGYIFFKAFFRSLPPPPEKTYEISNLNSEFLSKQRKSKFSLQSPIWCIVSLSTLAFSEPQLPSPYQFLCC